VRIGFSSYGHGFVFSVYTNNFEPPNNLRDKPLLTSTAKNVPAQRAWRQVQVNLSRQAACLTIRQLRRFRLLRRSPLLSPAASVLTPKGAGIRKGDRLETKLQA